MGATSAGSSEGMKRLLIISPAFPPHPSPATHRARFLARYGRENGWVVEVLAVDPRYYEEPPDTELLGLVPDDLCVTHTPAWRASWTRRLGVGDLGIRAYFPMRTVLRRICRERRPDLLYIPGGPFYTFLLGADMRDEFGIPYVLDYTDPWVLAPQAAQRKPWKKAYWYWRLALRLEPRAVRGAAHILAVSDGTNRGIHARYPDVPDERFSAEPFGFEARDYDHLRAHPRPNPHWNADDGNLHLVYVGAMLPDGYETVRALLRAVNQLRREQPEPYARLRLHFFGTTYDPTATEGLVMPVAKEEGAADIVDEHPRRIPYVDALNVLTSAHGILALGSTQHHYTASKIFPAILARRPLLAVYHEVSTVCDIMRATRAGELVTYNDTERAAQRVGDIARAIERMLAPGGYDPGAVRLDAMRESSAERMSHNIFRTLDGLAGRALVEGPAESGTAAHVG